MQQLEGMMAVEEGRTAAEPSPARGAEAWVAAMRVKLLLATKMAWSVLL
jgi:hypothetical protein